VGSYGSLKDGQRARGKLMLFELGDLELAFTRSAYKFRSGGECDMTYVSSLRGFARSSL
jgi:hypothetical protein